MSKVESMSPAVIVHPLRRDSLLVFAWQAAIVAIVLAVWELAPDSLLDDALVGRPSLIFLQSVKWLRSGVLLEEGLATLAVVLGGLLCGGLAGIALGLAAGLCAPVERLVEPVINVLFALPKAAFVPLFILWFGIGARQHTIFVAVVVFFLFFFAMFNGVRSVPNALRSMLAIVGASTWQAIRLLYLPASFNWLMTGVRLALPQAFLAAISAEIIASRNGLGQLVKANAAVMNAPGMFAALFFHVLLSVICSGVVLFLGERGRWRL
jgi:ABC-type nitrate/sulfonate/bicarbonate transport system permease component